MRLRLLQGEDVEREVFVHRGEGDERTTRDERRRRWGRREGRRWRRRVRIWTVGGGGGGGDGGKGPDGHRARDASAPRERVAVEAGVGERPGGE